MPTHAPRFGTCNVSVSDTSALNRRLSREAAATKLPHVQWTDLRMKDPHQSRTFEEQAGLNPV
jgi:hypothetical protein